MNGDADSLDVENGGEASEAQSGPEVVDVDSITDGDKLREILRNPEAFADGEGQDEEGAGESEEGEGEQGEGSEGSATEGEEESENGGEGEGDEEKPETTKPGSQREKVRAAHLDEVQRNILRVVSRKKLSLPEAQEEVFNGLVKGGKTVAEAEKLVYGASRRSSRSSADAGESEEVARETREKTRKGEDGDEGQADPIADTQKEIDDISEKLAAARKDYNIEEVEKLRDQRDDLKEKLRDLKAEAKERETTKVQTAEQRFKSAVDASSVEAIELFPDAAREGTELFEAIAEEVEDLKKSNPGYFKDPNWPINLAAKHAALLGIPSTKHKAGAKPAQGEKRTVQPKKKAAVITPASGASGGQQQSAEELTPEQELEAAGDDMGKLKAWTRKYGSRTLPVGVAN